MSLRERLITLKCFYFDPQANEVKGTVSLWDVREMIEYGLLRPDTQVMLSGSDYWRTYFEQENRAFPSDEARRRSEIMSAANTTFVYYIQGNEVAGPVVLAELFSKIYSDELFRNVMICFSGTEQWMEASRL
jgi:hypothetical protein